jgi:glycine cleavage system H lipoate-binding protein
MKTQDVSHFEMVEKGDGHILLSLSDHAKKEFKTAQYIELPPIGKKIFLRDVLLAIESTKAIFELETPIEGEVVSVVFDEKSPLEVAICLKTAIL